MEALWSVHTGGGPAQAIDFGDLIGQYMASPQISASGRYVAGRAGYNRSVVRVADLETDRRWAVEFPGDAPVFGHCNFDREERLVVIQRNGVISRWDPRTEEIETLFENVQGGGFPLWPDGRLLVIQNNRIWLVDLENGSRTELRLLGGPGRWSFQETPDGLVFVRANRDGSVLVWSDPDSRPHILVGHDEVSRLRVSPDGKWVSTLGGDGTVRLWPMPDLAKTPLVSLPHDELIARLKSLTNLRAVPDETGYSGYRIEPDLSIPRGWSEVPEW
ncbi:MAG: WD40 repeat domain-containing protein [Acidobacteriota bacterium]